MEELHASLTVAGLFYLANLTAPVAGYLVGARSDRTGNRLGLFRLCTLIGFAGWGLIALSTQVWQPFAISAILLGVAGAGASQLFAAIHDDLAARQVAGADGVVSLVRMALTAGWVIGPVLGAFLAATSGLRTMLLLTAVTFLLQLLSLGTLREDRRAPASPVESEEAGDAATPRPGVRAMLPLLAFTGLYVLVYAGEPVKYAYLPLRMNGDLHLPAGISGAVIGIQPLVELVLMPLALEASRRIGLMPLMVLGAAFAIAANVLFALSGSAPGLFAGQILMGGVWGIFAGLGIIVAQRLLPGAVATASAVFMSSVAIASALGGLTGGLGVAVLGLPAVFWLPAGYAALATTGIAVMSRGRHAVR